LQEPVDSAPVKEEKITEETAVPSKSFNSNTSLPKDVVVITMPRLMIP
jgi:hypothetical protein